MRENVAFKILHYRESLETNVVKIVTAIDNFLYFAGGQAYILSLWSETNYQQPSMHALHCMMSIGALLGPLVITPFLLPLHADHYHDNCTHGYITTQNLNDGNFNRSSVIIQKAEIVQRYDYNHTTFYSVTVFPSTMSSENVMLCVYNFTGEAGDMEMVRYGFVTAGIIVCLGAVLFFMLFFYEGCSLRRHADIQPTTDSQLQTQPSRTTTLYILIGTSLYLLFYAYMEDILGTYLAMVVVKQHDWTLQQAALLTSLHAGMVGVGGLVAMPISTLLSPSHMLICCTAVCTISLTILAMFSHLHDVIIWLAVAIFGLFIAPIFPSTMLWASTKMRVTGKAAGVMLVSNCLGSLSAIFLAGHLSQTLSQVWVMYLAVIGTLTGLVILITLIASSSYISRRSHKQKECRELSDEFISVKTE